MTRMIFSRQTQGLTRAILLLGLGFFLIQNVNASISEKVAADVMKSTVRVITLQGEESIGHGSGFVLNTRGHIGTNRHVVEDGTNFFVVYSIGDKVIVRSATVVAMSNTADLAILACAFIQGSKPIQLASAKLNTGQSVATVGFPGAIDTGAWFSFEGVNMPSVPGEGRIVSEAARSDFKPAFFLGAYAKFAHVDGVPYLMHSAKISPGNSGGPLVDAEGRVCGINTALIPAEIAGADYPISIHASELITLARAHSIPITVSNKSARATGGISQLQILLYVALFGLLAVMFLMLLRKPRLVMADAMSRVIHSGKQTPRAAGGQGAPRISSPPTPRPSAAPAHGTMRLRGRDMHGNSYDLAFTHADFQRNGNRLVIGRNADLSQLVLAQDSVSRQHATLTFNGNTIAVEDRNSGNGTSVNGREISVGQPPAALSPGDKLTVGEIDLIFEITR